MPVFNFMTQVTKLPKITARVRLQQWVGDTLHPLRTVDFDATRHILALSLAELRQLQDDQNSSDDVVEASHCPEKAAHEGPFAVEIEEPLETFLEAHGQEGGRAALTTPAWAAIRRRYAAQPAFKVSVAETRCVVRAVGVFEVVSSKAAVRAAQAVLRQEARPPASVGRVFKVEPVH